MAPPSNAYAQTLAAATISKGGGVLSDESVLVIGQALVGTMSNADFTIEVGIVPSLVACPASSAPVAELIGVEVSTKNRFLSFTAGDVGRSQAVRITFVDLPPPYDVWNGLSQWVTAPIEVSESGSVVDPNNPILPPGTPTFQAATLECTTTPHCMDWSTVGTIHVFGEAIVPSRLVSSTGPIEIAATYDVQVIDCACDATVESSFSAPLEATTAGWGDTLKSFSTSPPGPPDDSIGIIDGLGILGRFTSDPTSIVKARADLEPNCLDLRINISDVLFSLQGFQGLDYPFAPTALDPCDSTCVSPLP